MQENPAISDWVPISGGSTEGLLGGWLAQRQAALREVMAAGALSTFTLGLPCVPVILRAASVPQGRIFWKPWTIAYRRVYLRAIPKDWQRNLKTSLYQLPWKLTSGPWKIIDV